MAEARELPVDVVSPAKGLSNEENAETGSLSIVENVSQGESPRVPESGDLKIPDGMDSRTSESDRAAKVIEDELDLPDLPTELAPDNEILLTLVEENSTECASGSTSLSETEARGLKRPNSTHLGVGIASKQLRMSNDDIDIPISEIVEEMPLDGVSERTTPRKLFVRISKCAISKMDVETRDVVTVPTYSMVSLVKYPVFNLSLDKHIFRYANIWDQILPDIFIRYALGTEPRVPHSKIVEIGRKNILNHN